MCIIKIDRLMVYRANKMVEGVDQSFELNVLEKHLEKLRNKGKIKEKGRKGVDP